MASRSSSDSGTQLRLACEECHTRKIRCEPSLVEGAGGCCETCRVNRRHCQFSPKGKRGRPKKARGSLSSPVVPTLSQLNAPKAIEIPRSATANFQNSYPLSSHSETAVPDWYGVARDPFNFNSQPSTSPSEMVNIVLDPLEHLSSSFGHEETEHKLSLDETIRSFQPRIPSAPQLAALFEDGKRARAGSHRAEYVTDFMRALKLCPQLTPYCDSILPKPLSLLTSEDAAGVQQLLASLEGLCAKISEILPASRLKCLLDPPTCIVIFTAIMQAIDQVILKLGNLVELRPRPEQNLKFEDFVMDLGSPFSSADSEDIPASPVSPGNYTGIELENLLALTKLDFYILQMKSMIFQFNGYSDKLATTTIMFHPAESVQRLVAFHETIECILGGWRSWCC